MKSVIVKYKPHRYPTTTKHVDHA